MNKFFYSFIIYYLIINTVIYKFIFLFFLHKFTMNLYIYYIFTYFLENGCVVFITDCWKSEAKEYYITLSTHVITKDFEILQYNLGLRILTESQTGPYLCRKINEILSEWEVFDSLGIIVYKFNAF